MLSLSEQSITEDPGKSLYVKNIEALTFNRSEKNIIFVDTSLSNFANRLTNGVWLPPVQMHSFEDDVALVSLLRYLLQLDDCDDIRTKIKQDFGLTVKFDDLILKKPIMQKYNRMNTMRDLTSPYFIVKNQMSKSLFI